MRKLLSIMLVCFMLLGIIPTAFAEQPKANDVELLKHEITLAQNEETHLYLKITPAGGVKWQSSDDWVVEVNERGDLLAAGIGIAIVTVTSNDTGNSDQVRVTVTDHYVIYDSFDRGLDKWATYDYDGDGVSWIRASDYDEPIQALGWDAALCASYYPDSGDRLNSDDYLISTQFDIPYDVKTAELRFAVGALDTYPEQLYIYMNKDVSNIDDLIDNMIYFESVDSDYMECVIDLSEYIGWEDLTLAFNYYGNDQAGIWLDNAGIYIEYEKIDEIEITDADITPVAGDYADDHLDYSLPSDAHYTVTDHIWWDCTNDDVFHGTFVAGNEYEVGWYLYANDGYEFSPDCTVTVNGGSELDTYFTGIYDDGYSYQVWTPPVVCGGAELTVIPKIELLDVLLEAPEGELAGDYLTANVPSDANYAVSGVYWWDDTDERWVGNDETFIAGHEYSTQFYVKPNDGYKFDDTTELFINGSKDNVDHYYSDIMSDGKYEVWTNSAICGGGSVEDKIIDTINILNVDTQPVTGEKAGDHVSYTLPGDANYTVEDVFWYNCNADDAIEPTTTFEAAVMYQIVFKVVPNEGYKIAADATLLINNGAPDSNSYIHDEGKFAMVGSIPQDAMQPTDVTGVILHNTEMTMHVGENSALSWEVLPANAKNKNVTFTSSDESVAKVDDHGMVWAVGAGSAVITITTEEGGFTATCAVTVIESGAPSVTVGDCNGDGKINTSDAVIILKFAAGMVGLDANQQTAADTNHDGKVNTSDAVLILKYAAGMITAF